MGHLDQQGGPAKCRDASEEHLIFRTPCGFSFLRSGTVCAHCSHCARRLFCWVFSAADCQAQADCTRSVLQKQGPWMRNLNIVVTCFTLTLWLYCTMRNEAYDFLIALDPTYQSRYPDEHG